MKSSGVGGGGGGGGGGLYQGKRRWRCLAMGVLFLVVLSMLVPLVFLLGLYKGFHSTGYISDRPTSSSSGVNDHEGYDSIDTLNYSQGHHPSHVDMLIQKLGPSFPKDVIVQLANEAKNKTTSTGLASDGQQQKVTPVPPYAVNQPLSSRNKTSAGSKVKTDESMKSVQEENEKLCEMRFGSYCLWRQENKDDMKDSMVKRLKDQLFVARAYYPSVAKLPAHNKLSHELRQNIQEVERILSESMTNADLPPQSENKLKKIESAIAKAKTLHVDCNNVDKKLRQIFDMTEDEANFHMKQSAFLYQLAVQTMPKSLHCLSMRLTVEYFKSSLPNMEPSTSAKYSDPMLQHYIIFSNNVLASSVVINSTVVHARESGHLVFHVLTDGQNYFAMKLWFFRNNYKDATVQVLNIEDLKQAYHDKAALLNMHLPAEFRISFYSVENPPATHLRTEYVSIFSHSHYLLPYIFQNLKRIVVLDDDVVVQQDLSDLWNLNMGGKVNGALQLCSVQLGQLNSYLGENSFNKNSCAWMSGINVIDLVRWRELDLTETYKKVKQEVSKQAGSIEAVALSASLLTFQDLIYALDSVWALPGLGHDFGLNMQVIEKTAVLHYNGKMKPWLELGIPKYKHYWKRFLNREDQYLGECNVNP